MKDVKEKINRNRMTAAILIVNVINLRLTNAKPDKVRFPWGF